jgi:S-adenosylmethionine:tRNA ribosyltransferase-isomerase
MTERGAAAELEAAASAGEQGGRRLSTDDFDYPLDERLIAQRPLPDRDASRLLVLRRADGSLQDRVFRDLPGLMAPGDVLVLNDTRVFPARLCGRKPTGASAEILLVEPLDAGRRRWRALVRPGGKLKPGRSVEVSDELRVEIEDSLPGGERIVRLVTPLAPDDAIARYGHVPLPPYIRREDDESDRDRYQTVYARETGSVAAPTAGLHFTERLLRQVRERGVEVVTVTLHVGPGTFRPVEAKDPAGHELAAERYRVTEEAAEVINAARGRGGAVWAVGSTAVRTLETVADERGRVAPGQGSTDLFIRPGHRFRAVDRLITNFHLPRSTLLMLVAAFAGYDVTMAAYRHAMERGYRFYSYGDAMAIL